MNRSAPRTIRSSSVSGSPIHHGRGKSDQSAHKSLLGELHTDSVSRPPWAPLALVGVAAAVEVWFLLETGRREIGSHLVAALLGMFASILILGWFRSVLNVRRSSRKFSEWSGPIESKTMMWILVAIAWGTGIVHLWIAMYEILRPA